MNLFRFNEHGDRIRDDAGHCAECGGSIDLGHCTCDEDDEIKHRRHMLAYIKKVRRDKASESAP